LLKYSLNDSGKEKKILNEVRAKIVRYYENRNADKVDTLISKNRCET